jgi:hypothetical protein
MNPNFSIKGLEYEDEIIEESKEESPEVPKRI